MMRVVFGSLMLTASLLLLGCDPDLTPPEVEPSPGVRGLEPLEAPTSAKEAIQQALDLGKSDPLKAIAILESARKTWPGDREMLFLLSVLTVSEGEKAADKDQRIAYFHESYGTFSEIKRNFRTLNQQEANFQVRIEFGEARALALQGKAADSLAIMKQLMISGAGNFDSVEIIDDLKVVGEMPEFKAFAASMYGPKLEEAKKEVAAEMVSLKPFRFDFTLKDLDGKTISIDDYKGKVTIVDLWGTWCPPCRIEIPHFVALLEKYKDKGLAIVGINCNEVGSEEEIKKTIRDFAKANRIEYKCVLGDESIPERIPNFQGFPTTLFLDRTGKVREVFYQGEPRAKIEAVIMILLEEDAKPH